MFLQHGIKLQGLFLSEAFGLAGYPHSYVMGGHCIFSLGNFPGPFNHTILELEGKTTEEE